MLETDRLILRPWQEADRAPFAELNADPEVMRHFPATLSRAESDGMVDRASETFAAQGWGWFAVEVKDGAPFIGFVGLNIPNYADRLPFTPAFEIGWRLARTAWGQGYASEAAERCLAFAFHDLDRDEVVSFTARPNERSQSVMRRIGMSRDPGGDFDHPLLPEGHALRAHVLYRLRRADWEQRRAEAGSIVTRS